MYPSAFVALGEAKRSSLRLVSFRAKRFTGLRPAKLQSIAFTGLRPARSFFRRKRTQNALRRTHVGAAPAAPIRCASWQPQAGAELTRPCVQTAAPIPCGCLRCSPCFMAHCCTRPAHPCATARLFRTIPPHQDLDVCDVLRSLRTGSFTLFPWSRGPVVPWSRGPVVP